MKGTGDRGPAVRTPGNMGSIPGKPGSSGKTKCPNMTPSTPAKKGDRGPVKKQDC